jgi:hypothetical protein
MNAVIADHDGRPFAWGSADCFNFVMDAVEVMLGHADPYSVHRRRYSTESGAARQLRKLRATSAADLLAREFAEVAPAMAGIGDLVILPAESGSSACGLCIGHEIIMRGETSLCRVPRSRATRAFRV